MTMEECLQKAAQVWCKPSCEKIVMNVDLANGFAETLFTLVNENPMLDEQRRLSKAWEEAAKLATRNEDYYRGLMIKIGKMFGKEAYISDDGSVQIDVLCAKVPELVEAFMQKK